MSPSSYGETRLIPTPCLTRMAYDREKHHRRSIRLAEYDYRDDGAYFITISTRGRECAFGEIHSATWRARRRGLVALQCWRDIPNHRAYVAVDEFVVMRNHVHGVFWIQDGEAAANLPSVQNSRAAGPMRGSVGAIVGAYKAAVTRDINRLRPGAGTGLWQANYFEHIVRDQQSRESIRNYIYTNPQRWGADRENPVGDGSDDFETFIRSLDAPKRSMGEINVAPTTASIRAMGDMNV